MTDDTDALWLLKFDPFTIGQELYRTTSNLRNEIPGCAHDRAMQEFYKEASRVEHARQEQAIRERDEELQRLKRSRERAEAEAERQRQQKQRHQAWEQTMRAKGHPIKGGPHSLKGTA